MIGFEQKIIPLDSWISQFVDWLVEGYRPVFQAVKRPVESMMGWMEHGLLAVPELVVVFVLALIAWRASGIKLAIFTALSLFLVGLLGYAMGQPRINAAINGHVGSERRATILSTASLMVHLLFIPTSAIVGWISEQGGIMASLLWIGWQLMILSGIGMVLWKRSTDRVPA